ncbi:MAG: ribonuclease Z [Promethearchaeota archaeon]
MRILFLGTAGSISSRDNRMSSVAFHLDSGEILIFDTGEDVQRAFNEMKLKFNKPLIIFITHMHGDHVIGLPGLLFRMDLLNRTEDVHIFGPEGIFFYLYSQRLTIGLNPRFTLHVHELDIDTNTLRDYPPLHRELDAPGLNPSITKRSITGGVILKRNRYHILALKADHSLNQCYSYVYCEEPRYGKFNPERAMELGVPKGYLWGKLQKGNPVTLKGGRIIEPRKDGILGEERRGRTVIISGDTAPTKEIEEFVKKNEVDILIHESTFLHELEALARDKKHSTVRQAAMIAAAGKVDRLVLTHFSARYLDELGFKLIEDEAKEVFKNSIIAQDKLILEL